MLLQQSIYTFLDVYKINIILSLPLLLLMEHRVEIFYIFVAYTKSEYFIACYGIYIHKYVDDILPYHT
jgi:hypothetical protein